MTGMAVMYNPCFSCENKRCSMCELAYLRRHSYCDESKNISGKKMAAEDEDGRCMKTCPFCGGEAEKKEVKECWGHGDFAEGVYVKCQKCHARGGTASCKVEKGKYSADEETEQKAIEAWNRRADNG